MNPLAYRTLPKRAMEPIESNTESGKRCEFCTRVFARNEHLNRHRRTHTKEKPYKCGVCSKSFQRADVKASHEKACSDSLATARGEGIDGHGRGRKRARLACTDCRRRKIACDGLRPCESCRTSSRQCHYGTNTETPAGDRRSIRTGSASVSAENAATDSPVLGQNGLDGQESLLGLGDEVPSALPNLHGNVELSSLGHDAPFDGFDDVFGLDGMWSWPDTQNCFDDTDFLDFRLFEVDRAEQPFLLSPTLRLTTCMTDYFDATSRPSSPSRNKRGKMWYSAPPDLRNHNSDVVKVFIELFRKHVARTFDLFHEQPGTAVKHSAKYIFAMAAVGGLFSAVEGSIEVAKVMYNDARRLLMAEFNSSGEGIKATWPALEMVATFILLSIYGLCSGNKRSYEFVEAFQGDLTTAVSAYVRTLYDDFDDSNDLFAARLLEALYVLDCYRVVVMMRPPSLTWYDLAQLTRHAKSESRLSKGFLDAMTLVDGQVQVEPPSPGHPKFGSMASLAPCLWAALRPCQSLEGELLTQSAAQVGRSEFVGMALEKWAQLRQLSASENLPDLSMYHAMCILLHTNLAVLQAYIYTDHGRAETDPRIRAIAGELDAWLHDRDYEVASWHAESLMSSAEEIMSPKRQLHDTQQEAPHVPYAIYYAALVLYAKDATEHGRLPPSQVKAPLLRGEKILSLLRVHVAKPLARVLGEIEHEHSKHCR